MKRNLESVLELAKVAYTSTADATSEPWDALEPTCRERWCRAIGRAYANGYIDGRTREVASMSDE